LFSAIITAFLTRALDDLGPNHQQQTALLLHQLLNGRDLGLANISNPTIPFKPTRFVVAVNCLWFASLSASVGASVGAMICKEWLAQYNSVDPAVGVLGACQRHIRFRAFQRWNAHALVALLFHLLHFSILLFFVGAIVYLWQMDEVVAIFYQVIGAIFCITYTVLTFLPLVTNIPFRPCSTLLFHRLSIVVGRVAIPIVDVCVHLFSFVVRYATGATPSPFTQTIAKNNTLHHWYMRAATILPGEYRRIRVWWASALKDPLDDINPSQRVQEEAILWLTQMPIDPYYDYEAVVSNLASISYSHLHTFPKPVTMFLNSALEPSFHEGVYGIRTNVAVHCVLALGNIKFQSAVDRNSDRDHDVGETPTTSCVAWVAQKLTNIFQGSLNNMHFERIHAQLLTATAWLSPVDPTDHADWGSREGLKVQDRSQFIQEIKTILLRHVNGEEVVDNMVLINLIHGMHASIPRGNYGSASSIISFPPAICEDYGSPWSEDESVLGALITYALDLLSPPDRSWPLVGRVIKFDKLASELIDRLMVNNTSTDLVVFGFWLMYRVPYAFKSRETTLADIGHIWTSAVEPIQDDMVRQRLTFHAISAFVAVVQCNVSTGGVLLKSVHQTTLGLLNAALESDRSRPRATYAIAMVANLDKSMQVAVSMNEINVTPIVKTLFFASDGLERGATEEDAIDSCIHSALTLLKIRPMVVWDIGKVKGMIGQMWNIIGNPSVRDPGFPRKSEANTGADLDRVRWKAIYLSALLLPLVSDDERGSYITELRARVRMLVGSGELTVVADYDRCLKVLAMREWESRAPPAQQQRPMRAVFEMWVDGFPLFPLAGSVSWRSGQTPELSVSSENWQMRTHGFLNPFI